MLKSQLEMVHRQLGVCMSQGFWSMVETDIMGVITQTFKPKWRSPGDT